MLQRILIEKEVNITTLEVSVNVRYWEYAEINGKASEGGELVPFKNGDLWTPTIDIDSGKVIDWPEHTKASIHFKVCDEGTYTLLDKDGAHITQLNDYVPEMMCPAKDGYGDYIIMNIDENGLIENWEPSFEEFFTKED